MSSDVSSLEMKNPFIVEELDTSLSSTALRTAKLLQRVGLIASNKIISCPDPAYEVKGEYQPTRFVNLDEKYDTEENRKTIQTTTDSGLDIQADVYNVGFLGKERSDLPPVQMTFELGTPSDRGFKAPIVDHLSQYCRSKGRALVVFSSEGFKGRKPSVKQVLGLSFEQMAMNVADSFDEISEKENVTIDTYEAIGGSRGGTLSLLSATEEIINKRSELGKPDRRPTGVTAFAPAGLDRLGVHAAKQFIYDEPSHVIRKASAMSPSVLIDYGKALKDTVPPAQSLGMIAKTAILYAAQKPLEGIAERIPDETDVNVIIMNGDGLTKLDSWNLEIEKHPNGRVFELPGYHLSIDSLRRVSGIIEWHLNGRDMSLVEEAEAHNETLSIS